MSNLVSEISRLIQIKSEYDPTTIASNQPMGAGIAKGLALMEKIAVSDGFEVKNYDGYALSISYGEQAQRIEAVSHFDVVPATGNWSIPPYEGRVVGNRLYGRGSQDMKTALWLTYAALRKIKEEKLELKRQIRVVVGTDEERTMEDMVYYLKQAGLPDFAFTPDSQFPLCIGEKGAISWEFESRIESEIRWLKAGSASNVICGFVEVGLADDLADELVSYMLEHKIDARRTDFGLTVSGKSAHTSRPSLGINALTQFMGAYTTMTDEPWMKQLFEVFYDYKGEGIGLESDYQPMGPASVCLNVLNVKQGICTGEIDIRFPTPLDLDEIQSVVERKLSLFEMKTTYRVPAIITDRDNPFVMACLETYQNHFNDRESQPFYSGGVTYSKVYQGRCIAFGIRLPDSTDPSLAHQVDEYITTDSFEALVELYKDALIACANL